MIKAFSVTNVLILALILLRPLVVKGEAMKTLDVISNSGSGLGLVNAIAIGPDQSIWVAGQLENKWTVRRGEQQGTKWSTVDTMDRGAANSILITPENEIYVAGWADRSSSHSPWLVRKSSDQGKTWHTTDNFDFHGGHDASENKVFPTPDNSDFNSGQGANAYKVFQTADKHIIVCGSSVDHWLVRKSTNGGGSWTLIDNFQLAPGKMAIPVSGIASAGGDLIIVGVAWRAKLRGGEKDVGWLTRVSHDSGKTWANSDVVFSDAKEGGRANASDVIITRDGTWLVGGSTYYDASKKESAIKLVHRWMIRASHDKGKTWKTVDIFKPETENPGYPKDPKLSYSDFHSFALGPKGEIYAFGFLGGGTSGWKLRKSGDDGKTWSTVLPISNNDEYTNDRGGIAVSRADGTLYMGIPGGSGDTWTVKKW